MSRTGELARSKESELAESNSNSTSLCVHNLRRDGAGDSSDGGPLRVRLVHVSMTCSRLFTLPSSNGYPCCGQTAPTTLLMGGDV
ncbi:hypothetical protein CRG98_016987 [Punica granatum]|uniref:Uncharacterized protein n=1 Tax=Punica granatum TaxID=22663 RepID=A0A2I0K1Y7_PUNGR|nr:hypothetical protein CRG98_016987 [Punica granatum]